MGTLSRFCAGFLALILVIGTAGCAVDALFGSNGERGDDEKRGTEGNKVNMRISMSGFSDFLMDPDLASDENPEGFLVCSFKMDDIEHDGWKASTKGKGNGSHMGGLRFEASQECMNSTTGAFSGRGNYISATGDYVLVHYSGKFTGGGRFKRTDVLMGGSGKFLGASGVMEGSGQIWVKGNGKVEWTADVRGQIVVEGY